MFFYCAIFFIYKDVKVEKTLHHKAKKVSLYRLLKKQADEK